MPTHSKAYLLIKHLPPHIQTKLPSAEELIFLDVTTFDKFIQKLVQMGDCRRNIFFSCIEGCEALVGKKKEDGEKYDMQIIVRGVVDPRLSTSPCEEKKEMRSLVCSLFGMRSQIKKGKAEATIR